MMREHQNIKIAPMEETSPLLLKQYVDERELALLCTIKFEFTLFGEDVLESKL